MNSDQKAKGSKGSLTGCAFLSLGFILFALVLPSLTSTDMKSYRAAVKNGLKNGIKECVVRQAGNQSTNFVDAQSFAYPKAYSKYLIKPSSDPELKNSCFGARAEPINNKDDSWFEVNYKNGVLIRTCDTSHSGCFFEMSTERVNGNNW